MSDQATEPGDPDSALAAEYVLRLLDSDQEAACAERVAREPGFARRVVSWRADFAALDMEFQAETPPARLARRIEARLFGTEGRDKGATLIGRVWSNVGLWRGLAAVAALVAFILAAPIVPRTNLAPGHLVSSIAPSNSDVGLLAYFDPAEGALAVNRVAGAARPGRALELWVIPDANAAPISLGVLPDVARARITVPRDLVARIGPGAVLAVSDEAPGGSTTGAPGTIVAAGPISAI